MTPALVHHRCQRCGDLVQRIAAGSFDRLVCRACGDQALLAPAPAREGGAGSYFNLWRHVSFPIKPMDTPR